MTREPPLRFQREERAQVIFEAVARGLAVPLVVLLYAMDRMSVVHAAPFIGAGCVVGVLAAGPRLRRFHSIVLEPDGQVAFEAVIRRLVVPGAGIARVDLVEVGAADFALDFRLRHRGVIRVDDCEEFRMAAKYLKESHPQMALAVPKEVIYK